MNRSAVTTVGVLTGAAVLTGCSSSSPDPVNGKWVIEKVTPPGKAAVDVNSLHGTVDITTDTLTVNNSINTGMVHVTDSSKTSLTLTPGGETAVGVVNPSRSLLVLITATHAFIDKKTTATFHTIDSTNVTLTAQGYTLALVRNATS